MFLVLVFSVIPQPMPPPGVELREAKRVQTMQEGTFLGVRAPDNTCWVGLVGNDYIHGLDEPRHKQPPAGGLYNWGYGGAGPAALARGILFAVSGDEDAVDLLYQRYKWDVVAKLPKAAWTISREDVEAWIMLELHRRTAGDVLDLGNMGRDQ